MYELFYNFLIEELLVRYFKKITVEAGDKFYIVIEDAALRQDFYKALHASAYTNEQKIYFPGYEKYEIGAAEYDTVAFSCASNDTPILVSGCDDANDGFQTMIRNNIGVTGNPIAGMAALFILPGTNAIETLLSAGRNLQEPPYPLCIEEITKAIGTKISSKINVIEKEYLKNHVNRLRFQDDYTSLFDFAPVLSILQKSSLQGSFSQLDAFEDSEIYDNMFAATEINVKERVKDNTNAFAIISEMMSEAYEQDQYKRLTTYLDSKLASKISSGKVDWKALDYKEIRKSHDIVVGNPTITRPQFKVDGTPELIVNTTGPKSEKTSKNYVLICDPDMTSTTLKAYFNKDLKDYKHGTDAKVTGNNLVFTLGNKVQKDTIGDDKNYHEISALRLQTKNVFKAIEHCFKLDAKGNIVVNVPDSMDSVTIGTGTNVVQFDGITPIELDENTAFYIQFDFNDTEEPRVPFKFGSTTLNICFKYKGEKTQTLSPSDVTDTIWGSDGGFTGIGGETGTVEGPNGPVYIESPFRKFLNLEKLMIDNDSPYLTIEKNEFSGDEDIKEHKLDVATEITDALKSIFQYFRYHETVPSFVKPDAGLCDLYKNYIDIIHQEVARIPKGASLNSTNAINISKLGVVENEDGTIMLSPFHPLMVAYALEMVVSVDTKEFNKKVLDELSPLYLMPYIYYGKHTLCAINSTDTEDLLTWVKYDKANDSQQIYGSKATSKLITEKIKNFIGNFKYYFPDVDCPIRVSAIGLSQSVDLVRGIVYFIDSKRKSGTVQRIEIHEYVEDILTDTFFEKLNRQPSRDNIADFFKAGKINVDDKDLNEIIRLLFSRVSYYKHTFKDSRKMAEYSHVTFYKIDSGSSYSPLPAKDLRTETSLNGLVSIPSTNLSNSNYLMGFGTKGLHDDSCPIYTTAKDMNSLYAGLYNGGLAGYTPDQCTAKVYSFKDADFLQSVYDNSTWVTFVYPEVDIDFFYKQKNIYVVHYVEQHSISARLESITVTQHVNQYNKMLFNSLQAFKSIIGTSEDFSRKMISFFNCLNGKWLLDIVNKPELIMREKMSLVATCFVMKHFMKRTDNIIWTPIALDEIVRATGSIGMTQDGLFSKKDLGLDGPLSDDILMMGIRRNSNGELDAYFYPVEVKVLADDSVDKGEQQVANLYNKALKDVLFKGDTFTRKVYRTLFASQFLSNTEKMRANELMTEADYEAVNDARYELLNVKFNIKEDLPEDIGKAALVVYSDATPKSLSTERIDDVPVCHIRMMESECYRIVANPDSHILQFVEQSPISVSAKPAATTTSTSVTPIFQVVDIAKPVTTENEKKEDDTTIIPLGPIKVEPKVEVDMGLGMVAEAPLSRMLIHIGNSKKGKVTIELNQPKVVSNPNIGITGTMGTGKTQLVRSIIAQISKEKESNVGGKPLGLLVFDYKGDYNDDAFVEKVGGTCDFFNLPFNPLKILKTKKNIMQDLPAITAESIADSMAKAFGNIGPVQRAKITDVIVDTYREFGITDDYTTWDKPAPTINDVINRYLDEYDATDTVYSNFKSLKNYRVFSSKPDECVSIFEWMDRVRVIDLTPLNSDSIKRVVVSLVLDVLNKEMLLLGASDTDTEGRREQRVIIVVDEAHQFLQRDFIAMEQILRQGRAFGVGMILSTQNIDDFKTKNNDYATFMASWILHHVNSVTRQDLVSVFGATDKNIQSYMDYINKAQIFESIAKVGVSDAKPMHDYPYFELVKTDKRFVTKSKLDAKIE